jgi:hypothetical protein
MTSKVFLVHLRRPKPNDERTDPLYEFGSFGCTKCHGTNLLHPRHAGDLEGARLAFVQGGESGSRLVFLTPPITVKVWTTNCEVRWTPREMPFKYLEAPLLISNDGRSQFPSIKRFVRTARCPTWESCLSSLFRSRTKPLPPATAAELIAIYERARRESSPTAISSKYYEALPTVRKIDRNRARTRQGLIRALHAEKEKKRTGRTTRPCRIPRTRAVRKRRCT